MRPLYFLILLLPFFSCTPGGKADFLFYNGTVITLDKDNNIHEAVAVKDGKILRSGTEEELREMYRFTKEIDLEGNFLYPGFNDAHAHFYGLGKTLDELDLKGSRSWEEVMERTVAFAKKKPFTGNWILGRGWDQELWADKEFPDRSYLLDSLFPDQPVLLKRVDGHAAIANRKALELASLLTDTFVDGGEIIVKEYPAEMETSGDSTTRGKMDLYFSEEVADGEIPVNIRLTGVLIDNAVDMVEKVIPPPSVEELTGMLLRAQDECLKYGLTSVTDAGLDKNIILLMDSLHQTGQLKIRINAMANPSAENLDYFLPKGRWQTDRLNMSSFKIYGDGSLGSRGALLLEPYADDETKQGLLLTPMERLTELALKLEKADLQMNVHCIGDSAVRLLTGIFAQTLKPGNDKRWRIEHAQVVNPADYERFKKYNIIPSMQPTHATSDAPWAEERLGPERVNNAYSLKSMMEILGWIPLGTDFPVEEVNPLYTFYSAVYRQNKTNTLSAPFNQQDAVSPENALRGMTIWPAMASFEEKKKGSIEAGKWADFVILDQNLLQTPQDNVLKTKVKSVWIAGEQVFGVEE